MNEEIKLRPPVLLRWTVLIFISIAMMGNYYIYDSINPLGAILIKQLGFKQSGVTLLQAIYSAPNIFMVLIGGIIIDRIGVRKSTFLFVSLVMVGSIITCLSSKLFIMATGRLIFGLGAESMIIAITTSLAHWFKGKELAFAFGVNLTIARIGTLMAQLSPNWASHFYEQGWQKPLFIAASAGIIAFIFICIYFVIEIVSEKHYTFEKQGNTDKIELNKIVQFSSSFWFITILCFVFYSAIFPFTSSIGESVFLHLHHVDLGTAAVLTGIPTLIAMILSPFFGLLSDIIGRRSLLMLVGSFLLLPIYLSVAYSPDIAHFFHLPTIVHFKLSLLGIDSMLPVNQIFPMLILGIAFALVPSVMWPAVAYIVDSKRLGTAYGLMTMIQNIGLFAFNMLIGFANDHFHAGENNPSGYIPSLIIFACCGLAGVVFSVLLRLSAKKSGGYNLDRPMAKMK